VEHLASHPDQGQGPKYFVNIEGTEYEWPKSSISTEEIAQKGGWAAAEGVVEIDADNVERTMKPGETVEIKPGHGFSKKVKWKRG
jgi:hypothetical protein